MRKQRYRMRKSLLKTYHLRKRIITKDSEGGDIVGYDEPIEVQAAIWSAGGNVQAKMYGEKLAYVKNMHYAGTEDIKEGDGICVYVSDTDNPDYKVISVNDDCVPVHIMLEKIVERELVWHE